MKRYPSITRRLPKRYRSEPVYVFDKIDGSNLRFEWCSKEGWHRWGTRTQIVDETDPVFGQAWPLFLETLSEPLQKIATEQGWSAMVVFAEFWGAESFAGQHIDSDPKRLTLFDVAPFRKGFIGPEMFLEWFSHLDIPTYLGQHVWSDEFLGQINAGTFDGITQEGVIGKIGHGHSLAMAKAKTQTWKDQVIERYGAKEAARLLNS